MRALQRTAFLASLFIVISLTGCKKSKVTDSAPIDNDDDTTYIVNFANTELPTVEVHANEKVEKPSPNPEKNGYYFEDWFVDEIYVEPFNFSGSITSDTTIYAGFYADFSTIEDITNDLGSGESTELKYHIFGEIQSIDNQDTGELTISYDDKSLYIDKVFSADGTRAFNELETAPLVGDTLYLYGAFTNNGVQISMTDARLEKSVENADDKIYYTVTFANTDLKPVRVEDGNYIEEPEVEKDDYIFDGWYVAEDFLEPFDFNVPITSDVTIFASFYMKLSKAIDITSALPNEQKTDEKYYIKGAVKSIGNTTYGNMTITDGTDTFDIYGLYSADGTVRYDQMEPRPVVGDTVYTYGVFHRFNNTYEMSDAWLVKMKEGELPDGSDLDGYAEVSINEARNMPGDSDVIIEGIATRITYANGMKPNGFFLIDNTGAMYVFDYDIAASINEGDRIKVAGTRTNFVLDTEQNIADQLGYEGAIQLANATLLEKEAGGEHFDTSWIEETTIKQLMETDYKEKNITGNIYKVNGFIKEVPGNGFTNFYVNDLDDKTGSYSYSMNNGNDFTWLRQYDDDRLKTLYLAVINGKPSSSGLLYRFVPIEILGDYNYDYSYNPEFAVKYYGLDQFEKSYQSSPNKELITEVGSEKLGFQGVALEYESNNTSVVYFSEEGGNVILKTGDIGSATITVTGVDGGNTYSETLEIEVLGATEIEAMTVAEAIQKEDETMVTVKGIVAASLVNKTGFYLIDETGIVAIEMLGTELSKVELGNEVVITGNKTHYGTKVDGNGNLTALGQVTIREAEVEVNNYGNHEYSTAFFRHDKELADLINLSVMEEHSTEVYVLEATVIYEETKFYTRYSIEDDSGNYLNIYSSSGGQLSFLQPVQNQKVEIELALVNWNGKGYSGSIISVTHNGEKIVNNSNFR